jgi:hypothetical protein
VKVRILLGVCALACVASSTAHADPKMLKGPYLQDLAPHSITVMWQLAIPDAATLTVDGPGGPRTQQVGSAQIVEARIENLAAATRYRYTVTSGGGTWKGEFATAPEVGTEVPYSFVVLGDTRYGTDPHRRVVERMAQEVPDFVLGTGDMVDQGANQEQWQDFFDVENALMRDNVYFPALGNHDRQGRGRTADTYRAYFSVPENGGDTERYYAYSYATSRFIILDSNEYSFALSDQTSWLERELVAARADRTIRHIFIVMHHPPFSVSLHGGNQDLRERWTPLFEKYAVTAVFSGHDHVYERAEVNGLRYFVSGGGGAPVYPRRPNAAPIDVAAVKKFERVHHYLRVSVTGNRIEVTAVRSDGTTIETTTWTDGPPIETAKAADVAKETALAGGAGAGEPPSAPVAPSITPASAKETDSGPSLVWVSVGGVGLLIAAALVVGRQMRR